MSFDCDVCGKSFPRKQNLALHQLTHKPEQPLVDKSKKANIKYRKTDNRDIELNRRISRIEDAIEFMSTGEHFLNRPYYHAPRVQHTQTDAFDKTLKQYMQIMMIKQLAQATNSNTLSDVIKFQSFLDGREIDDTENFDPFMSLLVEKFAPNLLNSVKTSPDKKKKRFSNV